jgi:hypothetical protein
LGDFLPIERLLTVGSFYKVTETAQLFVPYVSPATLPSIFSDYSLWVHHSVNWDDRHLRAHAMASDFSVAWQFLSKRTVRSPILWAAFYHSKSYVLFLAENGLGLFLGDFLLAYPGTLN